MKTILKTIAAVAVVVGFASCEKAITFYQDDDQFILADQALESPEDAQKLLNSIYDVEANFLGGQMQNFGELLADNNDNPAGRNDDYTQVYNRGTDFFNGTISSVYKDAYIAIFRANVLLQEIGEIPGVTPEYATQVRAEARFIRALNNFMVVRLFAQPWGSTPGNTHPGITIRSIPEQTPMPRNSVAQVYVTILSDAQFAEEKLGEVNGVYATKWSAKALLAKVYFEMQDYQQALAKVAEIEASGQFELDDLDRFDYGGSTENLFYITSTPGINDRRGTGFSGNYRTDLPAAPTLRTNKAFYDIATADTNDLRSQWFDVLFPGASNQAYGVAKFNFDFLQVPVLHFTEMLLIKAECQYELGDATGSVATLNRLRTRANAAQIGALSGADLLQAVQAERRIEMSFEGDRVFQLKRLGVKGIITKIRNAPWNCNGMVLQFPNSEGTGGGFTFNPEGGCQ